MVDANPADEKNAITIIKSHPGFSLARRGLGFCFWGFEVDFWGKGEGGGRGYGGARRCLVVGCLFVLGTEGVEVNLN